MDTMISRKIIYISTTSYSDKINRDWYVKLLSKNRFSVEFWDISNISNNIAANKQETVLDGIKIVTNITHNEFSRLLNNNKKVNIIYIILASFHKQTAKVYRILNKYKPYTVVFNWGATPESANFRKKSFYEKILLLKDNQLPFKNSIKNILGAIYCKIIKKLNLIPIHDICFNAGIGSISTSYAKKTIDINLCDYDQYLKSLNKNITEVNQAVFIDSNVTDNSDIKLNGLIEINPSKYFESLSKYFEYFEKKYNTKVIISSHPTSNYNNNKFLGREVVKLKTAELVSESKYVLSHHSTAVSYAVLNYKPITFLMIDEWIGEYEEYANKEMSKSLGCNLINIDKINSNNDTDISSVNKHLYDEYKYNYIISKQAEGKLSSSIIIDEFNKYFSRLNDKSHE